MRSFILSWYSCAIFSARSSNLLMTEINRCPMMYAMRQPMTVAIAVIVMRVAFSVFLASDKFARSVAISWFCDSVICARIFLIARARGAALVPSQ